MPEFKVSVDFWVTADDEDDALTGWACGDYHSHEVTNVVNEDEEIEKEKNEQE